MFFPPNIAHFRVIIGTIKVEDEEGNTTKKVRRGESDDVSEEEMGEAHPQHKASPICNAEVFMSTIASPSLSHLLKEVSGGLPRIILVLDYKHKSEEAIKIEKSETFEAFHSSLEIKTWFKLQSSIAKFNVASDKSIVLITSSSVLLNALRHRLTSLSLFHLFLLCDSSSLLSLQRSRFLSTCPTYYIFREYFWPNFSKEGEKKLPKIIASFTASTLALAQSIADKENPSKRLNDIIKYLSDSYAIEVWWDRRKENFHPNAPSVLQLAHSRPSLLSFDLKSSHIKTTFDKRLYDEVVSIEDVFGVFPAILHTSYLLRHITLEKSLISSAVSEAPDAPLVMSQEWQERLDRLNLLLSGLHSHLLLSSPKSFCNSSSILQFIDDFSSTTEERRTVLAVKEKALIRPLSLILKSLTSSRLDISILIDGEVEINPSFTTSESNDKNTNLPLHPNDISQQEKDSNHQIKPNHIIMITTTCRIGRAVAQQKFFNVSLVLIIARVRHEHEIIYWQEVCSKLPQNPSEVRRMEGREEDTSNSDAQCADVNPIPKLVIATKSCYAKMTERLCESLNERTEGDDKNLPTFNRELWSSSQSKESPSTVKQYYTSSHLRMTWRTTRMIGGEEQKMDFFEIPASKTTWEAAAPFDTIPIRVSLESAWETVKRWQHTLHSDSFGGSGPAKLPRSPPLPPSLLIQNALRIKTIRNKLYIDTSKREKGDLSSNSFQTSSNGLSKDESSYPSHPDSIIWHNVSSIAEERDEGEKAKISLFSCSFPSHSPLFGFNIRPFYTTSIREQEKSILTRPKAEGGKEREISSKNATSLFLRSKIISLQKKRCTLHAFILLYSMNMLDDHLRPTWKVFAPTPISRSSCISPSRYSILKSYLSSFNDEIGANDTKKEEGKKEELSSPTSPASIGFSSHEIDVKAFGELKSWSERMEPEEKEEKVENRPKRGFGVPRPPVESLSQKLFDKEHLQSDSSNKNSSEVKVRAEALVISFLDAPSPHLPPHLSSPSSSNITSPFTTTSSDDYNQQTPPLGLVEILLISKKPLFSPHRLPHSFHIADKEHRFLICTLVKSEPIDLTLEQVEKIQAFHHRLFSLVKFSGTASLEANFEESIYQYLVVPLISEKGEKENKTFFSDPQSTSRESVGERIDWKSIYQTMEGIERPHSRVWRKKEEENGKSSIGEEETEVKKAIRTWNDWNGALVYYEEHPEQKYVVKEVDFEKSPHSPSVVNPETKIKDAMKIKHGYTIEDEEQPLLSVKMVSTKAVNGLLISSSQASFLMNLNSHPLPQSQSSHHPLSPQQINPFKFLFLVPEMVKIHFKGLPHDIITLLPSLLYRIESYLRVELVLKAIGLESLPLRLALQTFTPTLACEELNFELLETLGDCILKLCVAMFLSKGGEWPLGKSEKEQTILSSPPSSLISTPHLPSSLPTFNWLLQNRFAAESWSHRWISNANLCTLSMRLSLDCHLNLGFISASQMISAVKKGKKTGVMKESEGEGEKEKKEEMEKREKQRMEKPYSIFVSGYKHEEGSIFPGNTISAVGLTEKTVADFTEALLGSSFLSFGMLGARSFSHFIGIPEISPVIPEHIPEPSLAWNGEMREEISKLESLLHYEWNDKNLIISALTQESYVERVEIVDEKRKEERRKRSLHSLCLLGDALFDLFVFRFISNNIKDPTPGEHTRLKAFGVCGYTQSVIATKLGLHSLLRISSPSLASHINHFTSVLQKWMGVGDDGTLDIGKKPFWKISGLDYPEPLAMCLEAIVGSIFEDTGRDLEKTQSLVMPLLEPFWKVHLKTDLLRPSPSFITPDLLLTPLATHESTNLTSFWPKSMISSLQQHLPGKISCRAYRELPPSRLFFSHAYFVKCNYHALSTIGFASTRGGAQSDSALRFLHLLISLSSPPELLTHSYLISRLLNLCDCPPLAASK